MDPKTVGSLSEVISTISVDDVNTSLLETLTNHFEIMHVDLHINRDDTKKELTNV